MTIEQIGIYLERLHAQLEEAEKEMLWGAEQGTDGVEEALAELAAECWRVKGEIGRGEERDG